MFIVHLAISHIPGKNSLAADLLLRWNTIANNYERLEYLKSSHYWMSAHLDLI